MHRYLPRMTYMTNENGHKLRIERFHIFRILTEKIKNLVLDLKDVYALGL